MKFVVAALMFCLLISEDIAAQAVNPYHMNGSAIQENCNCYTLTPDQNAQSGSVWNVNKINLQSPFDYQFDVFLGCTDQMGADGIVFVLQPISISIGTTGGGLGVEGVNPSIAIAIDTWQNTINQDPFEDHISIHKNGDINHNSPNNLAGPVTAIAGGGNIEDCKMHSFRITWDPATKKLKAKIDGVDRVETTIDMVKDVFNGDPMVFWGFTASTGGSKNLQRFCTSLNAAFTMPNDLKTCFPVTIPFQDSSNSFGEIVKWHWDFGDGTSSSMRIPPSHTYAKPGNYDVKLSIVANNGCPSDTFKQRVVVGSKPVVDFVPDPGIVCDSVPIFFRDRSTVAFGTIDKWDWNINGSGYTSQSPGPLIFGNTGPRSARLAVSTKEGCIAEPVLKNFEVLKRPDISFSVNDVCIDDPAVFTAKNNNSAVLVQNWNWNFGDGMQVKSNNQVNHNYRTGGNYPASVFATSTQGCNSPILTDTVRVYETKANAGSDTILATGQSYQLKGSGGELYSWSPASDLDDPFKPDPILTPDRDITLILTASTAFGCPTTDVLKIKVYNGPEIYVPNAFSPNKDGKNDRFRPLAVGISKVLYFQVYNRYGQLIFSSPDTYSGWDGTVNGKDLPSATYVWKVAGIDFNGKQIVKKGTITLIR
ncbi:MAG: T9SS type B sorting domain-containing protein [Chitinophagaceae bacterium]|nr:MAG: T9SS type B sorting domain-containing protein [Chitinophagaceae bacterium]